ncbi:MAG TPA: hypothetical protein VFP84_15190 [Kofleriaceae bacterium]|nr:hypothetical protein [Kofleriaceae bacterium]
MKIVALWLATVALAVVTAGSCSVSHRSGDFACERTSQCAEGRVCSDGLCVLVNPPPPDAGGDGPPGDGCPATCSSCDGVTHTCNIDCLPGNDVCTRPITCPQGWNCTISCIDSNACRSGIDCRLAASCQLNCFADDSCRNVTCGAGDCSFECAGTDSCSGISCGTGACNVMCDAAGSCHDNAGVGIGVDCADSCSCNVQCTVGLGAACTGLTCPAGCIANMNDGCTARRAGCNTCP